MSETRFVTIQLGPNEYSRLSQAAERLGLKPSDLAESLVRDGLTEPSEEDAEAAKARQLEALRGLTALRARLPHRGPLDIVELIREGRDELDQRSLI